MIRKAIFCVGALLIGLSAVAQDTAAMNAVVEAPAVKNPAEKLYLQALSEREAGNPKQAIQTAVQVLALYANDAEWMPKIELLCAELYIDLELLDEADVTARQIQQLYEGTDVANKAGALRSKIEKLKESAE